MASRESRSHEPEGGTPSPRPTQADLPWPARPPHAARLPLLRVSLGILLSIDRANPVSAGFDARCPVAQAGSAQVEQRLLNLRVG
jgi:hypothetical protein